LDTKARKIPVDQIDSYREFLKAIGTDQTTFMPLFPTNLAGMSSSNSEAQALFDKGQTARQQNDMLGALDDYQAAVNRDPGFLQAWLMLGYMHMYTGDRTQGVIEMKKAIELAPFKPTTEKYVANTFQSMRMTDDALELWKTIEKQNPEDPDAPLKIGGILMGKEQYADALPELQHAARLNPANAGVLIGLGESYAKTGDKEHAIASFQKAVMLDHSPGTLNDAGYQLADNNVDLDEALHFAQDAVKSAEAQTSAISLDQVNDLDYRHAWMLSAYWDTIAWVDFRLGRLHLAEDYAKAAWSLALDSTTALHLGEIYEGEGKTHEAVIAYADALAADRENKEAQARLDVLRPDHHYQAGETVDFQTLQSLRTFTLPQIDSSATAEFDILFASDGKVAGVKFIHGSEALHGKGEQALKQTKFNVVFPEGSSAQILRPGLLNCETVAAKCTFVLLPITGR
jgi:tetratricopeptide (TPR) repeat protein